MNLIDRANAEVVHTISGGLFGALFAWFSQHDASWALFMLFIGILAQRLLGFLLEIVGFKRLGDKIRAWRDNLGKKE